MIFSLLFWLIFCGFLDKFTQITQIKQEKIVNVNWKTHANKGEGSQVDIALF